MANQIPYGFMTLQDIYENRASEIEPEVIDTALRESSEIYTQDVNEMLDVLVQRSTVHQQRIELPSSGMLQPLGEHGIPDVTRTGGHYTMSFPMWRAGDAFGGTREAWAKMLFIDIARQQWNKQIKDARWIKHRIRAAVFTNVNWTYKDAEHGDLVVKTAAKTSDGAIYLDISGDLVTAEHYTAQANAIGDGADNPYAALNSLLSQYPSNSGPYVAYIASNLVADTEALSNFYKARQQFVDYGANGDFAAEEVEQYIGFGTKVVGVADDMIIVEDREMPADYMIAIAAGAEVKPLRMREEPEAELQGFRSYTVQVNSNFRRVDFYRKAGFAAQNPVAFAVRRIADASYAIPAGYDASKLAG